MATVEVRFTALPAHVRTARVIASVVARRCGVDDVLLDEVRLAVGEACSRAVGLHAAYAPAEVVELTLTDDDNRFLVTVTDRGPAGAEVGERDEGGQLGAAELLDPEQLVQPAADPSTREALSGLLPAGFGIAVIAGLVDDLDVTPAEGSGTRVYMSWPRETHLPTYDGGAPR